MPQDFIRDEYKWNKAKTIVKKQYGKTEADGDEFWELVMGVYKQARGTIKKKDRTYYHHRRDGTDRKRSVKGDTAPRARKSLSIGGKSLELKLIDYKNRKVFEYPREIESDFLEKGIGKEMLDKYPGGKWVTMRGRHVYILKDGSVSKETDPRSTRSADVRSKTSRLYDVPTEDINPGSIYSYGNSTVMVTKVGRKNVTIQDANGKTRQVLKKNFAQKAEKEVGGKNTLQDLKKVAQEQGAGEETVAKEKVAKEKVAPADKEKVAPTDKEKVAPQPQGAEEAPAEKTRYALKTPSVLSAKGFTVEDGYSDDEAYDTYQEWKKQGEGAKVYFEREMVSFGMMSPERMEQTGYVLRKITKDGKPACFAMFRSVDNVIPATGEGAVEVGYLEIAPNMRKGHGLGTQMLVNAIAESFDRGHGGRIFLKSHSDAMPFYRKIGMNDIGGQYNIFDFTPDQARAFYKKVTGEDLGGGDIKKSLEKGEIPELTPVSAGKLIKFPSIEEIQRMEDKLYPTGLLIGDYTARVRSQLQPKYNIPEVDLDE